VPFAADTTLATLMARVETPVDVPADLEGLRPVLAWAGRTSPDERPDAGEFAVGLLAAAEDLARPEPLPLAGVLVGDGKGFDNDPTLLPAGGPARTTAPAADVVVGGGASGDGANGDGRGGDRGADGAAGADGDDGDDTAELRRPAAAPTRVVELEQMVEEVDAADGVPLAGVTRKDRRHAAKTRRQADRAAEADARRRAREAHGRRGLRRFLVAVLVIAVLAAAGVLAYTQLYTPSHDVPNFVGLTEDDATAQAGDLGWEVRRFEDRLDGSEPGDVIAQEPERGTRLQEGEEVTLTVSLGATLVDVPPDLVNHPAADVQAALTAAGFTVGDAERAFDEEIAAENVISLAADGASPLPARLPRGAVVDMTVSDGPAPRAIPAVPSGATYDQYAVLLQQQRLGPARNDQFHPTIPANQVISVSPAAGTEVARDSAVTVVVSKGPAVVVPNVVGQPLVQAITTLQQVGLAILETSGNGAVLSMDPPAGTQVPRGTGVRLFAST
jgi:serine/threonine-protein kinase